MPIKYAIRTKRTSPLTRAEQTELKTQGYSGLEVKYSYEDVPHIVAEMDEENGVYAAFSEAGVKLSDWMTMKKPEEVQKEIELARKKPGTPLKDSIGQDIYHGDYVFTHSHNHQQLELSQVVRNLKVKTVVEQMTDAYYWSGTTALRSRKPNIFIKLPTPLIEGGEVIPEKWEKRFSVYKTEDRRKNYEETDFIPVDEAHAMQGSTGHFGFFDPKGKSLIGWVPASPDACDQELLDRTVHAGKKVVKELAVPLTDIMGTDILLGDVVFSNDNHTNDFMICEVIGFTKERVRLVAYGRFGITGYRLVTLNWPKNIIKLPIAITTV